MYVYVIEDEFSRVKIGSSKQPERRWRDICKPAGIQLKRTFCVKKENHLNSESKALHHFQNDNITGEWFKIKFEEACEFILEPNDKPHYGTGEKPNMGINPKVKGAKGELEFINRFQPFFENQLQRNLLQTREGGSDITGCDPWVIEVKRCQQLEHNKWWKQVNAAVLHEYHIPVVAYRQNFLGWTFLLPSEMLGISHGGFIIASEDVWLQLVLQDNNH